MPMSLARFVALPLFSIAVAYGVPMSPMAQHTRTPESELREMNQRFVTAVATCDTATLDHVILAPDFGFIGSDGRTLDRASYLVAAIDPSFSTYRHLSADEITVRVWGDAAIVNARTTWTLATPSGERSGHSRFTDVYIRRDGRWQVVEAHLSRVVE